MNKKRFSGELGLCIAAILFLCLPANLNAQSIQVLAGSLDVLAEPNTGGYSAGTTTGQILIPFVDSYGSSATIAGFSPGDGTGGYVNCAREYSLCTPDVIAAMDPLAYNASGGDSTAGTFWGPGGGGCMHGGGTVTRTTFKHRLDKETGILIVKGTATVSGVILNYPYLLDASDCDTSNLIASYTMSGPATYEAQFILNTVLGDGEYNFQWMHISFNQY